MRFFHKPTVLLMCAALSFAASCAGNRDLKLAGEVVENYHRLYNQQNYEEIFKNAHEEARRTKSKEALGLALAEAFEKYGSYLGSELAYSKIQTLSERERQVELVYRSRFEKGTRNESFLIVTDDRKGALHSIGQLSDEELEQLKSK